jgi:hypothetical protein
LGEDILGLVEESRRKGRVSGALNDTFVALIHKSDKPDSFGGFIPISLCNLVYKIISKIIAVKIKISLSVGISKEQFGFLEGRQITDAVGVVQEAVHNIKVKNIKSLVLKLDLIKSYDRVDCGFLRLVLLQVGLSLEATDWIMGCVTSANYVVLINGKPPNFFKSSRGLRQGFPLSPLLFLLIVEGLSRLLLEHVDAKNIASIPVAKGIRITHLLFVDDVVLFGIGRKSESETYKKLLDLFGKATSMVVSIQKSVFLEVGWEVEQLEWLKELLPFDVRTVDEGFKYLGFHIKPNWWLSLGGRVTLVKEVLESISVYWLSLAKIPKSVLNRIRQRMFSFLWTGKKDKEGMHLVSWKRLSKPKKNGGWGIKNIFTFGKALEARSLWKCLMMPGIWHEVIIKKYLQKKTVEEWFRLEKIYSTGSSNFWRALTLSLPVISDWLSWKIGNGKTVHLGVDPIVVCHNFYKLSTNLTVALKEQGVTYLAQAGEGYVEDTAHNSWKRDEILGLEGDKK